MKGAVLTKVAIAGLAIAVSGCSYILPRKIPTLGLSQDGTKDCPDNERIYYYRNADAAICLPDVMVSYTHCVTELTVANAKSTSSSTSGIDIGKIVEKVDGIKLSDEQKRELERAFESSGVIGEARAKAIDACKEITLKVYGGDVAPNIEAAAEKFLLKDQPKQ